MTQKSQLTRNVFWLAVLGTLAVVGMLATPVVAQRLEPVVPGVRPPPTGVKPQRIPPRPAPGVIPKRIPQGGIGVGPSMVTPGARGANCRSSCGARCQTIDCSGLNVSRCAAIRQNCRASCSSRC